MAIVTASRSVAREPAALDSPRASVSWLSVLLFLAVSFKVSLYGLSPVWQQIGRLFLNPFV